MSWLVQLGLLADRGLNAETGGSLDQTLSLRAATAAAKGERWACVLCRVLSYIVQPRHCQKTLAGEPMRPLDYIRAGAAIVVAYGVQIAAVCLTVLSLS